MSPVLLDTGPKPDPVFKPGLFEPTQQVISYQLSHSKIPSPKSNPYTNINVNKEQC